VSSVVGDSQISLKVLETTFSCDAVGRELYFGRCCAVNWTGTFASKCKVMCSVYLTLRSVIT